MQVYKHGCQRQLTIRSLTNFAESLAFVESNRVGFGINDKKTTTCVRHHVLSCQANHKVNHLTTNTLALQFNINRQSGKLDGREISITKTIY